MIKNDAWVRQFVIQEESINEVEIRGGFNKMKASDKYKYGEKDPKDVGAIKGKEAEDAADGSKSGVGAVRVGKPYKNSAGIENVIFKVSKVVGKAGKKTITVAVPLELDGRKLSNKAVKDLAVAMAENKIDGMMKKLTAAAIQEAAEAEDSAADKKEDKKEKAEGGDADPEDLDLDSLDNATKIDLIDRIMQSLQDNCEEKEYTKCFGKVSDLLDGFMPEDEGDAEPAEEEEDEE